MAELLTPFENVLMAMSIDDWLELNPCECEALCTCPEQEDPHVGGPPALRDTSGRWPR